MSKPKDCPKCGIPVEDIIGSCTNCSRVLGLFIYHEETRGEMEKLKARVAEQHATINLLNNIIKDNPRIKHSYSPVERIAQQPPPVTEGKRNRNE